MSWSGFQAGLVHAVGTPAARRRYARLRCEQPALARFDDGPRLLAFLAERDGDLDEKDGIYAGLVRSVQAGGDPAELAFCLLWLGLWPGLDHVFRRTLRLYGRDADELVSDLAETFSALVARLDLGRVRRVAATLVRSTRRDLADGRRRRRAEAALHAAVEPAHLPARALDAVPAEERIARLRTRLAAVVGADAELLIGASIYGETGRDLADRLGLSHEAARKRVQRAAARARRSLDRRSLPGFLRTTACRARPGGGIAPTT